MTPKRFKNASQIYQDFNKTIPLKTIQEVLKKIDTLQKRATKKQPQNMIPIVNKPNSWQID